MDYDLMRGIRTEVFIQLTLEIVPNFKQKDINNSDIVIEHTKLWHFVERYH